MSCGLARSLPLWANPVCAGTNPLTLAGAPGRGVQGPGGGRGRGGEGRGEAAVGGDRAREAPGARPLPPVAAVAAGMRRSEWSRGAPL